MAANPKIYLALDIGERRIGLALARSDTRLPQPFGVLERDDNWQTGLKKIVQNEQVDAVVVGLPRGLKGQDTAQTQTVQNTAEQFRHLGLPVFWQDEALTSVKAEAELRQRGVRYNKADVDALAATYILEDFLSQHAEVSGGELPNQS